jgi:hypothetical protein
MLRPFPPEDADKTMRSRFQLNSDSILRSISSSSSSSSSGLDGGSYDNSGLSDLTNISPELEDIDDTGMYDTNDGIGGFGGTGENEEDQNADVKNDVKTIKKGGSKSEFILATIFKIVPIGVNIAKRGKTIATGFKEMSKGIFDFIKNTALLTAIIGMETIQFVIQFFFYAFKMLLCSIKLITNCPKCFVFYFMHIYVLCMIVVIVSLLFLFDVFLMIKYFTGYGLVELFFLFLKMLEIADHFIYTNFSSHIIHYPDSINNLCYNCNEIMGDTSGINNVASRLFKTLFNDVPEYIGGSIGETITGVGHILSFLNLK